MKHMTVSLEEEIAKWVRTRAAEQHQSVSRYLGDMLRRQMAEETAYEEAMTRYLSRKPSRISDADSYPKRDELYDRPGLR
ncbi:MAG TPA: CopG family transcriptional regulator [Thermoanaerobaculia bacterium]|nr:CopG family transcriptional regulator [Thermoanaerobaculia bacterium]